MPKNAQTPTRRVHAVLGNLLVDENADRKETQPSDVLTLWHSFLNFTREFEQTFRMRYFDMSQVHEGRMGAGRTILLPPNSVDFGCTRTTAKVAIRAGSQARV